MNNNKKVCVITGSRAEYGLLKVLISQIKHSNKLDLQLVATGSHLSPEFGHTIDEIKTDGNHIDKKVDMLISSRATSAIGKSIGLAIIGFSDALEDLKPDIIVVLGDRFEILAACISAMVLRIPIAHISGGEKTEGAIDESIRHSITKMSHFHFVGAEEYKDRVIQLGESPENVYNFGGLGVDNIKRIRLIEKKELEKILGLSFGKKSIIITFHPVTLEKFTSQKQIKELLKALDSFKDITYIFTMPNPDHDSRVIYNEIQQFCKINKNANCYKSLGHIKYISCLNYVDGVVGNSSSGIAEVPSFRKGTINIGDRQKGRIKAISVIDCDPECESIKRAILKLYEKDFKKKLSKTLNPYGEGGACEKIIEILETKSFDVLKKKFHDIDLSKYNNDV